MKKIIYIAGLLALIIIGISCNNDFLTNNDQFVILLSDTLKIRNIQDYKKDVYVELPVSENSDFSIFMQPKWLYFDSMHGKLIDGKAKLTISADIWEVVSSNQPLYGSLILDVKNVGLFLLTVAYTYTDSERTLFTCSPSTLNFETWDPQKIVISPSNFEFVDWEISEIPVWLKFSKTSGGFAGGNSDTIIVSLIREKIDLNQVHSTVVQIHSNTANVSFFLEVKVSEKLTSIIPEIFQIDGIVTDADYDQEKGIMVICTKTPNTLIVFNTYTNETDKISLDKTPGCVSLSEDGNYAVLGYTVAYIGYISIDNLKVSGEYAVSCIPHDIVFGINDWCYFTPAAGSNLQFGNLKLNSGIVYNTNSPWLYHENTSIKKLNQHPYLIGTCKSLSPSGVIGLDISRGRASDTVTYYNEDIGDFWISKDGSKLYSSNKNVYSLQNFDGQYHFNSLPVYGQIATMFAYLTGFAECPAINSLFACSNYSDNSQDYSTIIQQFNSTNLNLVKTFYLSPLTLVEGGIPQIYKTNPRYIFINNEGSKMYVIKNLADNNMNDFWSVETLKL